jgi:Flp pilus assembly protein TadD
MKMAVLSSLLISLFLCFPVQAEEKIPPEERLKSIQQKIADGDRRGAARDVEKWLDKEPKTPWPHLAAAHLSFENKKYRKCLGQAADALDHAPQNAEGYYWRGRCFEAEGKMLEAANEYRAALKAEAAHPQAHEGLARIEGASGTSDGGTKAN